MKRTTSALTAGIAAGVLLLAGCSSSVQGSAQTGTSAPTTTSSSSSSSSSSSASSSTKSSSTRSSQASDASGTALDTDTENWFIVVCGGVTDLQQYFSPSTAGQTLEEAQETVVDAYSNISSSAATTVSTLQSTSPPAIDEGSQLQTDQIARFTALSDVYGQGAQTISELTVTDEIDLTTAIDAIEAEVSASVPEAMANVDPDVLAAAKQIPECDGVI